MKESDKFLRKLSPKEREKAIKLIGKINKNKIADLDVKKLESNKNLYRLRSGRLRLIFKKEKSGSYLFMEIGLRDGNTYKDV